jgi:hypothetical protein
VKTDREPCLCPLAPSGTPRDSCPPLAFRSRLSHVRTRKHAQSIDLWSNTDLHTTWGADRALMATALNRITCAPCVQVHARGWCELLVCVRQTIAHIAREVIAIPGSASFKGSPFRSSSRLVFLISFPFYAADIDLHSARHCTTSVIDGTITIGLSSDDGSPHSKTCVTSPMIRNTEDALRSARSKAGTCDYMGSALKALKGSHCAWI